MASSLLPAGTPAGAQSLRLAALLVWLLAAALALALAQSEAAEAAAAQPETPFTAVSMLAEGAYTGVAAVYGAPYTEFPEVELEGSVTFRVREVYVIETVKEVQTVDVEAVAKVAVEGARCRFAEPTEASGVSYVFGDWVFGGGRGGAEVEVEGVDARVVEDGGWYIRVRVTVDFLVTLLVETSGRPVDGEAVRSGVLRPPSPVACDFSYTVEVTLILIYGAGQQQLETHLFAGEASGVVGVSVGGMPVKVVGLRVEPLLDPQRSVIDVEAAPGEASLGSAVSLYIVVKGYYLVVKSDLPVEQGYMIVGENLVVEAEQGGLVERGFLTLERDADGYLRDEYRLRVRKLPESLDVTVWVYGARLPAAEYSEPGVPEADLGMVTIRTPLMLKVADGYNLLGGVSVLLEPEVYVKATMMIVEYTPEGEERRGPYAQGERVDGVVYEWEWSGGELGERREKGVKTSINLIIKGYEPPEDPRKMLTGEGGWRLAVRYTVRFEVDLRNTDFAQREEYREFLEARGSWVLSEYVSVEGTPAYPALTIERLVSYVMIYGVTLLVAGGSLGIAVGFFLRNYSAIVAGAAAIVTGALFSAAPVLSVAALRLLVAAGAADPLGAAGASPTDFPRVVGDSVAYTQGLAIWTALRLNDYAIITGTLALGAKLAGALPFIGGGLSGFASIFLTITIALALASALLQVLASIYPVIVAAAFIVLLLSAAMGVFLSVMQGSAGPAITSLAQFIAFATLLSMVPMVIEQVNLSAENVSIKIVPRTLGVDLEGIPLLGTLDIGEILGALVSGIIQTFMLAMIMYMAFNRFIQTLSNIGTGQQ